MERHGADSAGRDQLGHMYVGRGVSRISESAWRLVRNRLLTFDTSVARHARQQYVSSFGLERAY
jgi:hypothetical protein